MRDEKVREVWTAIDDAFRRTVDRHAEVLLCQSGCGDCCGRVGGLTIAAFERDVILDWLGTIDDERRAFIRALASREEELGCVLLDEEARCSIYPARPLVCRAFGLPYRVVPEFSFPDNKRRLRVLDGGWLESEERVERTCMKNYIQLRTEDIPADEVIDQTYLNEVARGFNAGRTERSVLADVVREALGLPVAAANLSESPGSSRDP